MTKRDTLQATLAVSIFLLGNLQAWDSNVHDAGLWIVFLVSLAIALPPAALLAPMRQQYIVGLVVLSLILLILARLMSPIPLPGLFLILVPAASGLIFSGLIRQDT